MNFLFGTDYFYKIKIYKNNKLLEESDRDFVWPNGFSLDNILQKHNIIKINESELKTA
jgi:hypothetical protein